MDAPEGAGGRAGSSRKAAIGNSSLRSPFVRREAAVDGATEVEVFMLGEDRLALEEDEVARSAAIAIPAQMNRTNNAARKARAGSLSWDESFAYIERRAGEWALIVGFEFLTV
jgi:hypothetical protein